MRASISLSALGIGLLLVTACGAAEPVRPPFPARPENVEIGRIDPCALLDEQQRARLDLNEGASTQPTVNGTQGRGCVWSSDNDVDYTAQTIPLGADISLSEPGAAIVRVAGFGAVRGVIRDPLVGRTPACQVTVDASDGGSLRVQALGNVDPRPSDEEMCRLATQAAETMMTMVIATAGR